MIPFAASLFALICLATSGFQLALIAGAPWGELTLGGRWPGALPLRARLLPLVSLALLVAFATIILSRAGVIQTGLGQFVPALAWVVVAYCAVGVVANLATPSRRERALWLPVVTSMLVSSAVVAAS